MSETPLCPHDGQKMKREIRAVPYSYKGETVLVDMPGWYCGLCGEGVHTADDMKMSDRELNHLKAKRENLLGNEEIRRIRRKLGLTQAVAGLVLGGGPKAFSKYEKGDLLPSRAVVSVLKLLDERPEGLAVLLEGFPETTGRKPPGGRQKARSARAAA